MEANWLILMWSFFLEVITPMAFLDLVKAAI